MTAKSRSSRSKLTIPALFEIIAKGPADAEVETVPDVVARLVAHLGPLEDAAEQGPQVHGAHAEPQPPLLVALGQLQQSDGKGGLGPGLADDGAARGDVDEDVHAVIPRLGHVSGGIFDADDGVVGGEDDLADDSERSALGVSIFGGWLTQERSRMWSSHHRPWRRVTLIQIRRARNAVAPAYSVHKPMLSSVCGLT